MRKRLPPPESGKGDPDGTDRQLHDFLAALGSGLMAGLFFIFSVFIMAALGRLPPASGIAAMQSINVIILNGMFLSVFMGTALLAWR